jgi:hypothetical protein
MTAITYRLSVPPPLEAKARYAINTLADIMGIPIRELGNTAEVPVDILYGDGDGAGGHVGGARLLLPCDFDAYDATSSYTHYTYEELKVWGPTNRFANNWDVVGATFRLLALLDEKHVRDGCRDRRGVFSVACLPQTRREVCAEPLVENHAAILLRKLASIYPQLNAHIVPRWPNGKRYALVVTHDTDAVSLGSPSEMLYNATKGILRRDPIYLKMFWDGLAYRGTNGENPLFGFSKWREIEGAGLRSCFYLFARWNKLRRDVNDCRSSVADRGFAWDILRSMADDGWEFGFHAPIHAKDTPSAFRWGKEFIESRLGRRIFGVRHHYWALDWRYPHTTLRMHMDSGFRYDSSIAWRDSWGLRAGTCLPYAPFDLDANTPLTIWELPASLMDGHILGYGASAESNAREAATFLRHIKLSQGVAVLNWHTEAACNAYRYRDYVPYFVNMLSELMCESEAWITTPSVLIKYWNERHSSLHSDVFANTSTTF